MSIFAQIHGEDAPSGENLEYEKLFTDLLLAARPEEERQAGSEIIAAQEPDAKLIVERAVAVLSQSNDLRAAILYGYAATRLHGFAGLAEATGYLRSCLEDYWDSCHPQLDAEDDDDPTMRVNAVLGLSDASTLLAAVRSAPLTLSPNFGRLSLRDLAIAEGESAPPAGMDNPPTAQTVSAAFQDTPAETLQEIFAAIDAALADVVAINGVFDERLPGQGPNLDALQSLLKKARVALAPLVDVAEPEPVQGDASAGAVPASENAPSTARAAVPGAIESPADVEKALDRIIKYYADHEPSSPLPILLHRARRLIGADFMTIVRDLAPAGVDNLNLIGGMENPE